VTSELLFISVVGRCRDFWTVWLEWLWTDRNCKSWLAFDKRSS